MTPAVFWEGFAAGVAVAAAALLTLWWGLRTHRSTWLLETVPVLHPPEASRIAASSPDPVPARVIGAAGPPPASQSSSSVRSMAPPASASKSMTRPPSGPTRPEEALRLAQRILVHVARQGRLGIDEVAPRELCQAGMVDALSVNQGTLTGALRSLVDAGLLSERREHARGVPRRVKVYRLTSRGELLARELRPRGADALVGRTGAPRTPAPANRDVPSAS
ncbi:MAG: MarR family winged helix-turn-helix transcriptional regulator [Thermoplasmata archaeon]|nr:MarR family winged helix-turn-helix transcriptional regulator [Thermoplasmata archaeon]